MDNDFLTFRVARSLEMWLHAADYPGSHVIIRNPQKKDIPDRTLIEAAELAAFYSDAREQPKAAVHYTQRKFVNKPRKSAPGLVSLASHRTIMVKPQITAKKKED
jgi:predicted ribosome quality control (RQC) complex YloA/Tae2 family protein